MSITPYPPQWRLPPEFSSDGSRECPDCFNGRVPGYWMQMIPNEDGTITAKYLGGGFCPTCRGSGRVKIVPA
jgi:hypothetical protein